MNEFKTRLNILIEILYKKRDALITILNICENEEVVFSDAGHHREIIQEMTREKQKGIDAVLGADEIFEGAFDSIRGEFEKMAQLYRNELARIQALITEVCELDMKIRLQEEKNKTAIKKSRAPENPPKAQSSVVAKSYIAGKQKRN